MFLDRMLDLYSPDILTQSAAFLAKPKHPAAVEPYKLIARLGVDFSNGKALLVAGPLVGKRKQVSTILESNRFFFRTLGGLHMDTQLGLNTILVVNILHTNEGVVGAAFHRSAGHHYLLDQL